MNAEEALEEVNEDKRRELTFIRPSVPGIFHLCTHESSSCTHEVTINILILQIRKLVEATHSKTCRES